MQFRAEWSFEGRSMTELEAAQMQTTAEEYLRVKEKIRQQRNVVRDAEAELERLNIHLNGREKDLARYVGQNIYSRCVRTKTGEALLIRYRGSTTDGPYAFFEVYDTNGEIVR